MINIYYISGKTASNKTTNNIILINLDDKSLNNREIATYNYELKLGDKISENGLIYNINGKLESRWYFELFSGYSRNFLISSQNFKNSVRIESVYFNLIQRYKTVYSKMNKVLENIKNTGIPFAHSELYNKKYMQFAVYEENYNNLHRLTYNEKTLDNQPKKILNNLLGNELKFYHMYMYRLNSKKQKYLSLLDFSLRERFFKNSKIQNIYIFNINGRKYIYLNKSNDSSYARYELISEASSKINEINL